VPTPANPKAIRDLTIDTERQDGTQWLRLRGELDLTSAAQLTSAVARACAESASEVVLDVSELGFVDSSGLRAILNGKALCEESLCAFSLTPPADQVGEQVRRLLEVTGLLGRLPFRPSAGEGSSEG
jgi:anti-sigma B factor antagonist